MELTSRRIVICGELTALYFRFEFHPTSFPIRSAEALEQFSEHRRLILGENTSLENKHS